MGNLSIFEEEVLAILRQLECCCEIAESQNPEEAEKNKFDSFTKNTPKEVIVTLRGVGPRFAA